jgi:hypothetical protein
MRQGVLNFGWTLNIYDIWYTHMIYAICYIIYDLWYTYMIQAGLSRATLDISSTISICSRLFFINFSRSPRFNKWLLRYSTLNSFRSSSIGGYLHFQQFSNLVRFPRFKFKSWGWSKVVPEIFHFWYFEVVFHLRSSSLQSIFNFGSVPVVYVWNLRKILPVVAEIIEKMRKWI